MEDLTQPQHMDFFKKSRKWLPNFQIDKLADKFIGISPNGKIFFNKCIVVTWMSYNVLADSYLSHVDYGDVDPQILEWEYRHKLIL